MPKKSSGEHLLAEAAEDLTWIAQGKTSVEMEEATVDMDQVARLLAPGSAQLAVVAVAAWMTS